MRLARWWWSLYCFAAVTAVAAPGYAQSVTAAQTEFRKSGSGAPVVEAAALREIVAASGATAIVLNAVDGRVLASAGDVRGIRYTPGSTLKPFVLLRALTDGIVRPATVIPCRGTLMVDGRNLACTHPRELRSFTAETALAYSCNQYFATVAGRMQPEQLLRALADYGVHASGNATAFNAPSTRVLLALGLAGVRVTVTQLAEAYRHLALNMSGPGAESQRAPLELLQRGLEGSVKFGMAYGAATEGVRLAGKTGTASEPGQAWTHGWFAGIVSGADRKPQQIVVVLVPRGSGGDAALLAHKFFTAERGR